MPQQQYAPPPGPPAPPAKAGFFKGLFDLSFSTFVTTSVIKVLYVFLIVIAALASIGMLISGGISMVTSISLENWGGVFVGLGMVIISPLVFVLYLIVFRIYMELLMVVFRIAEDIRELNQKTR